MEKIIQNTKEKIRVIQDMASCFFASAYSVSNPKSSILNSTRRGVTLLELLIYIAILSGLMVVVSDAFISLSKGRGQAEARSEVNSAIRFAGDIVKRDIKNATAVTSPSLGTPGSALTLTVGGVPIVYDMVGGVLRRSVSGAPENVTGGSVSVDVPTFTRIENFNPNIGASGATTTAVQIVIMMRYNALAGDWSYSDTLRTTATLR